MKELDADRRPSTDEVLADLVAVRAHRGISVLRVRELAKHLQRLRATESEIQARGLSNDDADAAAFHVVRCAVQNAVERTDLRQILHTTLNLIASESNLTERREEARHRLVMSPKEYTRAEREAFMQLAGELVLMSQTPCPFENDKHEFAAHTAKIGLTVTFDDVNELGRLLAMMSFESREKVQDRLADQILSLLPKGAARSTHSSDRPWVSAVELVRAAMSVSSASSHGAVILFMRQFRSRGIDPRLPYSERGRKSYERRRRRAQSERAARSPLHAGRLQAWRVAVETVAEQVMFIEQTDQWELLLLRREFHNAEG